MFDDTQKFYDIIYNTIRGNLNLRRWIKLEPIYSNEHLLEGKFYIVAIVADVLMNDEVRRQAVENQPMTFREVQDGWEIRWPDASVFQEMLPLEGQFPL